jgi:predicted SAM-dependent methyltransferase
MKLNLGCGTRKIHGFINIDSRLECGPDAVIDIRYVNTLYKNKATLIYACHVLEHFSRNEIQKILANWYDCLRPGGTIRLSVPDFDKIVRVYTMNGDLSQLYGYLYGGQKNEFDYHKIVFNLDTLSNLLKSVGFININKYDWRTTEHAYVDDYSQAYIPHMDKINGTLMSLNIEATKPELDGTYHE